MKKRNGIIIILFLGVLYYFAREKWGIEIPCFFHEFTGFFCPGCGITRLFVSLIHLDFYNAFRYNPLVFVLMILYGLYIIVKLKYKNLKIPNWVIYVILGVTIGFGILRNVPGFEWLRPI